MQEGGEFYEAPGAADGYLDADGYYGEGYTAGDDWGEVAPELPAKPVKASWWSGKAKPKAGQEGPSAEVEW